MNDPLIRPATPDELDVILSIDDDASRLYTSNGLHFDLSPDHPFIIDEQSRWQSALQLSRAFLAIDQQAHAAGMIVLGDADNNLYIDQLSVRLDYMRQGFGSALLKFAITQAAHEKRDLWLTTYDHLHWNQAFYERHKFAVIPTGKWGPDITNIIQLQQRYLPNPEHRIAMSYSPQP